MNIKVLTDEQEAQFVTDIIEYGTDFVAPLYAIVGAIEQAVLKSPEIQALRKDAERYRYIKKGTQWVVAATQTGHQIGGEELDDLIDSEMEQQE